MSNKTVRYDVALSDGTKVDGSYYVLGHIIESRRGLTKSEFEDLKKTAVAPQRWICTGWNNPGAGWMDE